MVGRILIADDVATNRIVLKVKLASAFYDVIQASSGQKTLEIARKERPDLIILDVKMPDMDGVAICEALRNDPLTEHTPIIMIASAHDSRSKLSALRAGADDILFKPFDELILLARVRSLMRAGGSAEELRLRASTCRDLGFAEAQAGFEMPSTIALITAQKDKALRWRSLLQGKVRDRVNILSRNEALQSLSSGRVPDMFIIAGDLEMPDEGLRLLSELKSRTETRYMPVMMILREASRTQAIAALDMGASDVMYDEFDPEELAIRVRTQLKRKRQSDRLRETVQDGLRMAVIDPLTGLYNRRYAIPHLARIQGQAMKTKRSFAVMILDLDRFKSVNDGFGHAAGDEVLTEVSRRIKANLREEDLVARIGGEEFLIAMPDTPLNMARGAAERLRRAIESKPISVNGAAKGLNVTLSIGVAMGDGNSQNVNELMGRADRALFSAKSDGRNQVTVSLTAA
ncbi:diguanylate cyclase [Falsihalocynthiibacter sp. SS001]|uniref:diguanylate cyclase n=1 Tax=Falsihalocynthiibacter sp. SS001 TaxID=3349698 RepID=UPI0036D2D281